MQIKVNQVESSENQIKVFVNAFETGRQLAKEMWGE